MEPSNVGVLIGIIGALASLAGLTVAGIQTARINKIKREEKLDIWNTLRHSKQIKHQLFESKMMENAFIARAFEANQSLFRTQLKRAVLLEKSYSEETIGEWKKHEKISGDWEEKQAKNYLEANT